MRYDKKRNKLELKDLIGATIIGTGYMELKKGNKTYALNWDYEYGWYNDVSIIYTIKELE